ncbi:15903_t:CDS:2, partial [Acaulospora morrowiae]
DQVNCPFYLKTGACRFGDSCGRNHPYPEKSVTILIKNMYEGMPVQLADEDNDDNLEIEEAEKAINATRGRWYAGKQLICEYCPVTKWKSAICGYYERNKCPKGIQCNFLHVYKNPGNLYAEADKDYEYLSRKSSVDIAESTTHPTVTPVDEKSQSLILSESSNVTKHARSPSRDESQPNHPSSHDRSRTRSQHKGRSPRSTFKLNSEKSRHRSRSRLRSKSRSRSPKRISRERNRHGKGRNHKCSSKDYNHGQQDVKI